MKAGGAVSPLLASESSMNTFIEGGRDAKEVGRLQKAQGKTNNEAKSEEALKACYERVRALACKMGMSRSIQVQHYCL